MSLNSLSFNWDLISKWRAHLMGIGILGVMIGHLLEWINANRLVYYAFIPFVGLVFTEGFLLLSGFGLFCSFRKNGSVSNFYNKRAKRLLYPYWIMVIPLCALTILSGESSLNVLLEILTFKYWIFGNTALWYISVTLVLYLLFPLLYNYCFRKGDENIILLRWLLVLVLFYSIGIAIWSLFPNYFDATYLGYTQMPMFIIGMGIGYLYTNKKHLKFEFLIILLIAIAGMAYQHRMARFHNMQMGLKDS